MTCRAPATNRGPRSLRASDEGASAVSRTSVASGLSGHEFVNEDHPGVGTFEIADDERAILAIFEQRYVELRYPQNAKRGADFSLTAVGRFPLVADAGVDVVADVVIDVAVLGTHFVGGALDAKGCGDADRIGHARSSPGGRREGHYAVPARRAFGFVRSALFRKGER